MSQIKKYFGTGLLITLPVFLTLYILTIAFIFLDNIWGRVINIYLKKYLGFAIPGVGLILGVATVFIIGFIATNFFGRRLFAGFESVFLKLPFIRQVYPSAKLVVHSIVSKEKPAFRKVALVEYPSQGLWSIGFVTNDGFKEAEEKAGAGLVHIFIATTPSPFTGFLVLIPKDKVKYLDMSVEDGIKLIVSGGILKP